MKTTDYTIRCILISAARVCVCVCVCDSVCERSRNVHENIQSHLDNPADRSLERLSAVSHSNAARLSLQYLGRHQRNPGG